MKWSTASHLMITEDIFRVLNWFSTHWFYHQHIRISQVTVERCRTVTPIDFVDKEYWYFTPLWFILFWPKNSSNFPKVLTGINEPGQHFLKPSSDLNMIFWQVVLALWPQVSHCCCNHFHSILTVSQVTISPYISIGARILLEYSKLVT